MRDMFIDASLYKININDNSCVFTKYLAVYTMHVFTVNITTKLHSVTGQVVSATLTLETAILGKWSLLPYNNFVSFESVDLLSAHYIT